MEIVNFLSEQKLRDIKMAALTLVQLDIISGGDGTFRGLSNPAHLEAFDGETGKRLEEAVECAVRGISGEEVAEMREFAQAMLEA